MIQVGDYTAQPITAYAGGPVNEYRVTDPNGTEIFKICTAAKDPLLGEVGVFMVLSQASAHKHRVTLLNADYLSFKDDAKLLLSKAIIEYRDLGLGASLAW